MEYTEYFDIKYAIQIPIVITPWWIWANYVFRVDFDLFAVAQ